MSKSYNFYDDGSSNDSEDTEAEEVVEEQQPAPVEEAPKSDGVSVVRLPSGRITNK